MGETNVVSGIYHGLQNVNAEAPDNDPFLVRIGSGAVPCLALDSMQQLWCGCGNAITIISSQSVVYSDPIIVDTSTFHAGALSQYTAFPLKN